MDLTILICTHNSAARLPETLQHLRQQKYTEDITWEVIIVDYISSDHTSELAQRIWAEVPIPLQIIHETKPGKTPALETGLEAARGTAVCIVDDDNWVCKDYVRIAIETMEAHPDVGVIGAFGEAACEVSPPFWFEEFKMSYAVGAQAKKRGYADEQGVFSFWGAGMVIRKEAWLKLKDNGFKALLNPARPDGVYFSKGSTGGEDPELCYAIQMTGYRLWYEPDLTYKHFIPTKRLTLDFLKNAWYGVYAAYPIIMIYRCQVAYDKNRGRILKYIYGNWYLFMLVIGIEFCKGLLRSSFRKRGTRYIHCLSEFRMLKGKYDSMIKLGAKNFCDIIQRVKKLKVTQE